MASLKKNSRELMSSIDEAMMYHRKHDVLFSTIKCTEKLYSPWKADMREHLLINLYLKSGTGCYHENHAQNSIKLELTTYFSLKLVECLYSCKIVSAKYSRWFGCLFTQIVQCAKLKKYRTIISYDFWLLKHLQRGM